MMRAIGMACFAGLYLGMALASAQADSPNVVLIYIDDLGYSDVGFMGAPHYLTPQIDQLADSGMIFTNAYAAAPNCAPSRACLMSGQYSPRHGIYTVGNSQRGKSELRRLVPEKNRTTLPASVTTLGELFQSADYQTAYMGKWHLGSPGQEGPLEQGFDINIGGNKTGTPKGGHHAPYKNPQLPDPEGPEYLTDRLTDEAIQFIEQNKTDPFFLFLSHYAVHTPVQAKPAITKKYQRNAKQLGINAKYAAMIESVDESVGRITQTLADLSLTDNTMVIFYSDNGGHGKITSNAPLRGGKGMMWEGGIRVPLAISWPGHIAANSQCDVPIHGVDFFETFRVLLNAAAPQNQPLDGVNILPLATGQVASLDRALYWHFPAYLEGKNYPGAPDQYFRARPFSVIRKGPWKLVETFEDQRVQLFNLEKDLGETQDVSQDHPEITKRLAEQLKAWRSEVNAPVPDQRNPDFESP
ncbi:MAG: sulfatase [Pirellulaceae bacterium]|nr:sulfatase [Pirellulaceae bacterium]